MACIGSYGAYDAVTSFCYLALHKVKSTLHAFVTFRETMQIGKEEKRAKLDKILQGRSLHGSENLKAFLRFIVDKSTENQENQLKEYVIATEVFGRGQGFDSRVDSVVRVQAS